jgi:hypothetical protein
MTVFSLFMLVLFIYSVLGVYMFGDINEGAFIDDDFYNFRNFANALITLYKIQTGEDWNYIMEDIITQGESRFFTLAYFISFKLFVSDILINLFVLVVIQ